VIMVGQQTFLIAGNSKKNDEEMRRENDT